MHYQFGSILMEHEKCVHFFCFCFCFVECKYARKITIYTMLITVFKYDPPTPNTYPHSVYLLPNLQSFIKCDLRNAIKLGNATQGAGEGFEFVLKRPWQPHYFACGEHDGIHCKNGTMKFFVMPIYRWYR